MNISQISRFTRSIYFHFSLSDHHKSNCVHLDCKAKNCRDDSSCSNKMIQIIIVVLVIIMAVW